MCIIKTSFQDVLVQAEPRVAYFHPSALNGLLFGKGHPVNRPPWPSSLYKGSALPVLINVGVTISWGSKATRHMRDPKRLGWH